MRRAFWARGIGVLVRDQGVWVNDAGLCRWGLLRLERREVGLAMSWCRWIDLDRYHSVEVVAVNDRL